MATDDGEQQRLVDGPSVNTQYHSVQINIAKPAIHAEKEQLTTMCNCECDCECERGVPIVTSLHIHRSHGSSLSPKHVTDPPVKQSLPFVVLMTFMTLFMSVVGAGMLSIPYIFASTPFGVVVTCLVVVGLAMGYTAELLVRVYMATNITTFNGLALAAYGPTVSKIVSGTTIFAILGACVGCLEIVIDLSPFLVHLLGINTSINPATIVLTVFLVCIYPLTLLKKLTALRFSSYVGFVASTYLVLAVTLRSRPSSSIDNIAQPSIAHVELKVAHCVSVFNYAFVSHLNVIPLFVNLQHAMPSARGQIFGTSLLALSLMQWIIYIMSLFCIGMYSVFGTNALALYGSNTQGNILLNLENDSVMEFPRVAVLVTILFSFPLLFHPYMMLVEAFVLQLWFGHDTTHQLSRPVKAVESMILLLLIVAVATVMPGIQVTFSLTGASCVTLMCYVFPVMCYLRICPNESVLRRGMAVAAAIFGVVTGAIATVMVFVGTLS
ncbi:unnamed protein product [Aphanomyces euteiches]|uniref:Amino acid transporter transmembrane domain-containing protein n=1 Tax=Aphanomyces euteiches TaxID=100861 RepID=A0A6G0X9G5_9STRA|nr:hypothetical protein Ae201684_007534 [Aphanomyces euteiches]KAH9100546.1 hypothetical protein Ae201684P_006743 [Aphanomyces euteiches]KAH9132070.1 hypothetical protein AeRB84_021432 [Aphanomyces euteiches]